MKTFKEFLTEKRIKVDKYWSDEGVLGSLFVDEDDISKAFLSLLEQLYGAPGGGGFGTSQTANKKLNKNVNVQWGYSEFKEKFFTEINGKEVTTKSMIQLMKSNKAASYSSETADIYFIPLNVRGSDTPILSYWPDTSEFIYSMSTAVFCEYILGDFTDDMDEKWFDGEWDKIESLVKKYK